MAEVEGDEIESVKAVLTIVTLPELVIALLRFPALSLAIPAATVIPKLPLSVQPDTEIVR